MNTVAIPFMAWGTPSMMGGNPLPVVYTRYDGGLWPDSMSEIRILFSCKLNIFTT